LLQNFKPPLIRGLSASVTVAVFESIADVERLLAAKTAIISNHPVRYLRVTLENFPVSVDRFSTGAVSEFIEQINARRAQELKLPQSVPSTKAAATTTAPLIRFGVLVQGLVAKITNLEIHNLFQQLFPV
jgi:hypothetical protein